MLFLCFPLCLFKILWQKAGIQMMLFRSRSTFGGAVWEAAAVTSKLYTIQYQLLGNRYKRQSVALSKG